MIYSVNSTFHYVVSDQELKLEYCSDNCCSVYIHSVYPYKTVYKNIDVGFLNGADVLYSQYVTGRFIVYFKSLESKHKFDTLFGLL